jgi:DNA-directed RNA polymerase subunit RPC12/RpoP
MSPRADAVTMPVFRCTACGRRIESPVVIGAGDCPHCGGDVVFDLHGDTGPGAPRDRDERESRPRRLLRRLLGG